MIPDHDSIHAKSQEKIGSFEEVIASLSLDDHDIYCDWEFKSIDAEQIELVEYLKWEEQGGIIKLNKFEEAPHCCVIL